MMKKQEINVIIHLLIDKPHEVRAEFVINNGNCPERRKVGRAKPRKVDRAKSSGIKRRTD